MKRIGKWICSSLILTSLVSAQSSTTPPSTTQPKPASVESNWDKEHPRRDEVNDRLKNQSKRIEQEKKEGDLTQSQARKLHVEDQAIRLEEKKMASKNDGHITRDQMVKLNRQENRVGRQIGK